MKMNKSTILFIILFCRMTADFALCNRTGRQTIIPLAAAKNAPTVAYAIRQNATAAAVDLGEFTGRGKIGSKLKFRRKFKHFLLPLLLAYKLKFFTLIPVLIGGLILLSGATGMAGFFFALFAAVMGLKNVEPSYK